MYVPPLGNKAVPLELEYNLPQLGIDSLDLLNVGLGPSPVLRVRCNDPRLSFRCPRPGALAAVKLASVLTSNSRFLAESTATILSKTTFAGPTWSETCCDSRFNELSLVSFC